MASINRELNVEYFGIKIRKIEPVINPVEGFKVKVPFFLGHPVYRQLRIKKRLRKKGGKELKE